MTRTVGTVTCPRCGERLPEGFTRCDACGAFLVAHPSPSSTGAARPAGKRGGAARGGNTKRVGAPWIYLAAGLIVGGGVGYALHSAVGPRGEGGAPTGPADIMAGGGTGATGAAPSGTMPPGAQMPPEVVAAIQKYRQALMMDPNDLEANIGMGNLTFDSGQYARAIGYYTKALEKDPKNADVRVDRAIAYHSLGQDAKAKEEMLRVTREHPDHPNAWLNLGIVSQATNDPATAIRAWERYLALEPNGEHAADIRAGLAEMKKGS